MPFKDSGLSLVEVMISMMILALVLTGLAYGLGQATDLTRNSRDRQTAANLVAQALDRAQGSRDFADLNDSSWDETVNGVTFTLLQTVTEQLGDSESPCDGPAAGASGFLKSKSVTVAASWPAMTVDRPVTGSTLVDAGVNAYDPDKGNLSVVVNDAVGSPVLGATVEVDQDQDGSIDRTGLTDSNGCAFFFGEDPATYEIVAKKANHVDPNGETNSSQVGGVSAGTTTAVNFELDRQSIITFNLPADAPAEVPTTLANSRLLPNGLRTEEGTGTARSLSGIYPFESGYYIWAGQCADADPTGVRATDGVPFHGSDGSSTPSTRGDVLDVAPGQSSVANFEMATVELTVVDEAGDPVIGVKVSAVHDNDSDGDGTADEPYCTTAPEYELGTTDTDGKLFVSLPWGLWQFLDADGTYVARGGSQNLSPAPPLGDGPAVNIVELEPVL